MHSERLGPHPIEIIREAVAAARAGGIPVALVEDLGVHQTGRALVTWARDREPVVSPCGALLLHAQPQVPDADRALVRALDAPIGWIEGFVRGSVKLDPEASWLMGPRRQLYLIGFEAGTRYRIEFYTRRAR